jgi:3-methyladenine DNA glycosylase AlkD
LNTHFEIVNAFCKTLINRDERFCKTAVGWVLREISKTEKKYVVEFLEVNKPFVTYEVKQNAIKYFAQ